MAAKVLYSAPEWFPTPNTKEGSSRFLVYSFLRKEGDFQEVTSIAQALSKTVKEVTSILRSLRSTTSPCLLSHRPGDMDGDILASAQDIATLLCWGQVGVVEKVIDLLNNLWGGVLEFRRLLVEHLARWLSARTASLALYAPRVSDAHALQALSASASFLNALFEEFNVTARARLLSERTVEVVSHNTIRLSNYRLPEIRSFPNALDSSIGA